MQNDSLLPFLYYSFLCNFTSIYVFFLSICKKYIKYALHFLLKLLLTIHLWRMLPDFHHEKEPPKEALFVRPDQNSHQIVMIYLKIPDFF